MIVINIEFYKIQKGKNLIIVQQGNTLFKEIENESMISAYTILNKHLKCLTRFFSVCFQFSQGNA